MQIKKNQTGTILLGIAAGALVFIGLKIASAPSQQKEDKPEGIGTIAFSETSWDLGEIPMTEGVNTKEISITNSSDFPVKIVSMETSCMCTNAQIVHENGKKSSLKGMVGHGGGVATMLEKIEPNETVALLVNFDPNAHGPSATGPITREVIVRTNNPEQSEFTLTFTGTVSKERSQTTEETKGYKTITAEELKASLATKDFFLIDVHTPEQEHIKGTDAVIPYDQIGLQINELPTDKNAAIVLYCRSGSMSQQAAQTLVDLGYTNITHVEGGKRAYDSLQ